MTFCKLISILNQICSNNHTVESNAIYYFHEYADLENYNMNSLTNKNSLVKFA